jgi:2-hydroxychromene-2-carboxylate isomerase
MATDHIDFWFTMGSTYSYLSVMRLVELERSSGIRFRWRPFHLLVILQEMKHVPFADKPRKSAYMWRDIDRRAAMYGIPVSLPAPYPAKRSIVANLVASAGMREGWGIDFVRAAYRRWLQLGQETGSEPNVSGSLRDIGIEPQPVLASADAADAKAALMAETGLARELGIFAARLIEIDGFVACLFAFPGVVDSLYWSRSCAASRSRGSIVIISSEDA